MFFAAIKRYMPRRLYGRAVLIFLMPIVLLQLIVANVIIQRHFDGVTRQLARGVALELSVLTARLETLGALDQTAHDFSLPLGLRTEVLPDDDFTPFFRIQWYDRSGRVIKSVLEAILSRPVSVDLIEDFRRVDIGVLTSRGVLQVSVPRSRMSASNPHQLLLLTITAAVLLTIISLIFLRNQVRPIKRLAHAAEAFGKGHSVQFRPQGAEEVRRAGSAFLAMRTRIERQIEQRTMMLSGVSHDLRTPITRMKLGLATADSLDDLADIDRDLTEMEHMLDEFLAFARGDSLEDTEEVDAVAFTDAIVANQKRMGASLNCSVISETTDNRMVFIRKMAMQRAITNLINNGLRHGDEVAITVILQPRAVSFVIEDNGPGIAPADRGLAMKPFARLDTARNQDRGSGVGLGLAIAMDVTRSHGGSLSLDDSQTLGGLKATIRIPR